jgi:hypothetical protein
MSSHVSMRVLLKQGFSLQFAAALLIGLLFTITVPSTKSAHEGYMQFTADVVG